MMPNRDRLLVLALRGLEAERARIDKEIEDVKSELNQAPTTRRRKFSAQARRNISLGMKRRFADLKAATERSRVQQKSTGITTAGRKRLSEMMKARWAAKRKATKRAA